MREALKGLPTPHHHVALAYDAWAPVGIIDGKVPVGDKNQPVAPRTEWLSELGNIAVSPDYAHSFERWKASFLDPGDRLAEFTLLSRLLIGHGNSSATDVGLTVHHTWGVPVIPGSALKGLVAHYVDATYGPADSERKPWEQQGDEHERAKYQGVTWNRGRVQRGPGGVYRALFGAPNASGDDAMREHGLEAGAAAGIVTFHDALYVPDSVANKKPFAADVLTVHQKNYYDSVGKSAPNDYDSPNPVAFLTVRPTCRLQLALSGPSDWTELAGQLLKDALESWGVGGKTSAGYGVGTVGAWKEPELHASQTLGEFEAWLANETTTVMPQRQRLQGVAQVWLSRLLSLNDNERHRAANHIKKAIKSPKLTYERDQLVAQLEARVP